MPWKGEKDPYKIWISEIILQQTRVEQGLEYYNRFIAAFPDVHTLADAPDQKVFKFWEGLGYYSRCRNLIASAKYIAKDLKGKFPSAFEDIKSLKGVGPYTAAAISSFAFNLPHAVVDGNVFRVLSRIYGICDPVDTTAGKKKFNALADQLLDKKNAGTYNQAIMDFGAVICKPAPLCDECPFNKSCYAFLNNQIKDLPVKQKKIAIKRRWFYYLVLENDKKVALQQRTKKDIWQLLYEFPMIERSAPENLNNILSEAEKYGLLQKNKYHFVSISPVYKQQLSHQLIAGQFISIRVNGTPDESTHWIWSAKNKLDKYPFPRFINEFRSKDQTRFLF